MNLLKKIKVLKSNPHYRIGDVVFRQGYKWKEDSEIILLNPKYRNTILNEYLRKIPTSTEDPFEDDSITIPRGIINLNLLYDICSKREVKTDDQYLYVHIRSGDILQLKSPNKQDFFMFNPLDLISKIKNYIEANNIKKVLFATAMHFGDYREKNLWVYSEQYLSENLSILDKILESVSSFVSCDILASEENDLNQIDQHFCSLINARNTILDGGGFANVIRNLHQMDANLYTI